MAEKYRPSNGSEGEWFMSEFCCKCAAYNICKIWPATMAYNIDDPKYPSQWVEDDEGVTCTSFVDKKSVERKPYHCNKTMELPL